MIAGVVAVAAEAHNPEGRRHGALAWGGNGAGQQRLGFQPSPLPEQRCEGNKNRYNCVRQGEHGLTCCKRWSQASIPCFLNNPKFCTKSSLETISKLRCPCRHSRAGEDPNPGNLSPVAVGIAHFPLRQFLNPALWGNGIWTV